MSGCTAYFAIGTQDGKFSPNTPEKLSFYISAIDGTMHNPGDRSDVGLLLCEIASGPVVEYALHSLVQPIGVSNIPSDTGAASASA